MAETITAKTAAKEAPKKLTVAEILAKRREFEEMIQAQLAEERPAALDAVKEQIATFTFTAEELGFASLEVVKEIIKHEGWTAAELGIHVPTAGRGAGTGDKQTRVMSKPLKNKDGSETGVWLAHPPKFLDTEGCFTEYKAGKSIDAWLVNPADKKAKINFLKKLASRESKAPTKEQLGEITEAEFKAE
ncbi:hypothetical protein LGN04_26480 [Burkholderia multivorans]|nr:hypothetical protein [Burkholderia multivorans]